MFFIFYKIRFPTITCFLFVLFWTFFFLISWCRHLVWYLTHAQCMLQCVTQAWKFEFQQFLAI